MTKNALIFATLLLSSTLMASHQETPEFQTPGSGYRQLEPHEFDQTMSEIYQREEGNVRFLVKRAAHDEWTMSDEPAPHQATTMMQSMLNPKLPAVFRP
ncbi:MAG: hypothetical protein C0514_08530 [Candidatus Puniceispirillum sp.]|nr:hypothetical protein [Candidatus Puniceispirillum sp.]